nr:hypothetical protein [Butyricimonas synergistica]
MPAGGGDFNSNYWLTCITVEPGEVGFMREDVRLALEADNIECRPLWKSMHLQLVFKDAFHPLFFTRWWGKIWMRNKKIAIFGFK